MNVKDFAEINRQHAIDINRFRNGEGLTFDLFSALFDYYCKSNEMPYGVAKARTGDPYEWIDSQFTDFLKDFDNSP
jgi:hypothetical protein